MDWVVDTCVLLDILDEIPPFAEAAAEALDEKAEEGETENERNDSRSLNGNGGPEFIVTPTFRVYPPSVKTLRVGFAARGKGMIRLYSFAEKNLKPVEVQLDSADWKRYETDIPLCDTHPRALTVRFISQKRDPIDFDDLVVAPAAARP